MTTGRINQITIVIVIQPSLQPWGGSKMENNVYSVYQSNKLIIEYRKASILRALVPNANRIVFEIG